MARSACACLRLLAREGHRGRGVIRRAGQAGDLEAVGAVPVLCDLERGGAHQLGGALVRAIVPNGLAGSVLMWEPSADASVPGWCGARGGVPCG
jgi:hypothetical protein